jgi:hypothetical protein
MIPIEEYVRRFAQLRTDNRAACHHARRIQVHSRGESPAQVIIKRHPSEDEASFQWRLDNFVCITKPLFAKAFDTLHRIFQSGHYAYHISESTQQYLKLARFQGLHFDDFIQQQGLRWMLEDPNAWAIALPKPNIAADAVEVELRIIPSERQRYRDQDFIIYQDQPVDATLYSQPERAYILTRHEYAVLALDQYGDYTIAERLYHGLGEVPMVVLGGNIGPGGDSYESFFAGFVEFGDEALRQFSDWQSIMASCAYPVKEVRATPCTAPDCHHGRCSDGTHCSTCQGTGWTAFHSPFAIIVRPEAQPHLNQQEHDYPMLRFHAPDTQIIAYAQQAWEKLLQHALDSLHLGFVLQAQSGVAKALDREELYALLSRLSRVVYHHLMGQLLWWIERIRLGEQATYPTVHAPISFHIHTEADLTEELTQLSALPGFPMIQRQAFGQFCAKKYHTDPAQQRAAQWLLENDSLLGQQATDIALLFEKGLIQRTQWQLHQYAPMALQQIIQQRGSEWMIQVDSPTLTQTVIALIPA